MRAAFIGTGGLLGYMLGAVRGRWVVIPSRLVWNLNSRTFNKGSLSSNYILDYIWEVMTGRNSLGPRQSFWMSGQFISSFGHRFRSAETAVGLHLFVTFETWFFAFVPNLVYNRTFNSWECGPHHFWSQICAGSSGNSSTLESASPPRRPPATPKRPTRSVANQRKVYSGRWTVGSQSRLIWISLRVAASHPPSPSGKYRVIRYFLNLAFVDIKVGSSCYPRVSRAATVSSAHHIQ